MCSHNVFSWHNVSWEAVIEKLDSNIKQGLSKKESKEKQAEFGKNILPGEKPLSKLKIVLDQFKSPLIYILVVAGLVVLFFKEFSDAIVIFGAVFLNTVVGYIQESKASNALRELKKVVKVQAKVLREGNIKIVDASELVPGDIVCLSPGDKVPADGRIIENHNLKINEMALTGEWLSAEKTTKVLSKKTPLADRDNMVYMGTIVEYGKARVVIVSTGLETEIGRVAKLIKETKEEKTPLQKKLSRFSKFIGVIIALICIAIFVEGVITGNNPLEMFTVAVAVAVAAIPEGLPVAMTVILALGMQKILKRKGLARTLTLTEGKMIVARVLSGQELLGGSFKNENHSLALKIATLVNEAFIENPEDNMKKWVINGEPTDKALLLAGIGAGFNKKKLEKEMKLVIDFPFDSIKKYSARLFSYKNRNLLYAAGAPEKLLELSKFLKRGEKEIPLNQKMRDKIEIEMEKLAEKGLRIVAVAYGEKRNVKDLVFTGLIAMKDPVRKGVKEAIKICREAGLTPIIVTGDHKLTAKAVAQEIGFIIREDNIMEGRDLDKLSDKEFKEIVKDIKIYARVEPKHKMRIVQAWQSRGEVVAMTGDGINDAPALKKADIGLALGSGTEVAKEVSDLVLLSDNFNVIVAAIEEGRAIIDNIRKVITYLLSDSFTETILIGTSLLFGFPLPVIAVQILWVNLIEDGLPDIALAFEPKEKDLMKQKPQGNKTPLLTKEMKAIIFIIGIVSDLLLLGLFFWLWRQNYDIVYIRTMVFAALAINSLLYVFSCKSLRQNIWQINLFSNKLLVFAWVFGVVMLVAAVYLGPLQTLLKTMPLGLMDWMIIMSLGVIELFLIEITKWIFIVRHQTNV